MTDCLRCVLVGVLCFGLAACGEPSIARLIQMAEEQPVVLHAQFVDQDGKVIPGVRVNADVWSRSTGGSIYGKQVLGAFVSDESGTVQISGANAGYLRLVVQDDSLFLGDARRPAGETNGLVIKYSKNGGEGFWTEHGAINAPTVIPVWRKLGPQSLVALSGEARMEYDANVFGIDLVEGLIVKDGGDIRVEITAEVDQAKRKEQADNLGFFKYSATVNVIGGAFSAYLGQLNSANFEGLIGIPNLNFDLLSLNGPTRASDKGSRGVPFAGFVRLRNGTVVGRIKFFIGMEPFYRNESGRVIVRIEDALFNLNGLRSLEMAPGQLVRKRLSVAPKE